MKDILKAIQRFCILQSLLWKVICQYINKAIPETYWPSEWQTENVLNVNIEIFLIYNVSSMIFNLKYIHNKKTVLSVFVTDGQAHS